MFPTNKCCAGGGIAPNGDYYGTNDPDIKYIHLGISNGLMDSGIIPKSRNPDRGLELNGGIKQHSCYIVTLDSSENENPMTDAQIKTLINVIGQDYTLLFFVNQEKCIRIDELAEMNKWEIHYKLIK